MTSSHVCFAVAWKTIKFYGLLFIVTMAISYRDHNFSSLIAIRILSWMHKNHINYEKLYKSSFYFTIFPHCFVKLKIFVVLCHPHALVHKSMCGWCLKPVYSVIRKRQKYFAWPFSVNKYTYAKLCISYVCFSLSPSFFALQSISFNLLLQSAH